MAAETIFQRPPELRGARGHVVDQVLRALHRFGPHQVDIAPFGRRFLGRGRKPTEIEGRAFAADGLHPWRVEVDLVMLAIDGQMLAIQQRLQDMHRLHRAAIAGFAVHLVAGQVGRDDVDVQPPARNLVQRRDLPRQLRGPAFTDAHRHQQLDPRRQHRNRTRKGRGVETKRIARRQQDIVKSALFGVQNDIAAMLPTRRQHRVGLPQKFIVIIAQGGKPADFDRFHGSGTPLAATSTLYQSARVHVILKASAASAIRAGFCEPTMGMGRAGCAMIQL